MKNTVLPIKGMHCRSCELMVEENLKEISGVCKVEVDHAKGQATVHYTGNEPGAKELAAAVKQAGYEVGHEVKAPWIKFDINTISQLIIGTAILLAIYLLLRFFGVTDISVNQNFSSPGLGLVLLTGLVAGISTCMAITGSLVLGLSAKFVAKHPTASTAEKLRPHFFFNGGRIVGYALLGGVLGTIGSVFQFSNTANAILTLLVAALMLFIGLQLTNVFPRLSNFSFSLPTSVAKKLGINKKKDGYSHRQASILGALTFFLPCGFTQAMQVYAVSRGSFWEGAIIMGLFAIGTAPGLLGIGTLTSTIKNSSKGLFFKTAGLAIVALSFFNLANGSRLLSNSVSFLPMSASEKEVVSDPNVVMEDGFQVVRMVEHNRGYTPNKFTIREGIPVKWVIDAQAPNSCAAALVVPQLGIREFLVAGENIIEFTPEKVGQIRFSCSMGMYSGVFNVVASDGSSSGLDATEDILVENPTGSCGGGCSGGGEGSAGCSGCAKANASPGSSGGCGCGGGAIN